MNPYEGIEALAPSIQCAVKTVYATFHIWICSARQTVELSADMEEAESL